MALELLLWAWLWLGLLLDVVSHNNAAGLLNNPYDEVHLLGELVQLLFELIVFSGSLAAYFMFLKSKPLQFLIVLFNQHLLVVFHLGDALRKQLHILCHLLLLVLVHNWRAGASLPGNGLRQLVLLKVLRAVGTTHGIQVLVHWRKTSLYLYSRLRRGLGVRAGDWRFLEVGHWATLDLGFLHKLWIIRHKMLLVCVLDWNTRYLLLFSVLLFHLRIFFLRVVSLTSIPLVEALELLSLSLDSVFFSNVFFDLLSFGFFLTFFLFLYLLHKLKLVTFLIECLHLDVFRSQVTFLRVRKGRVRRTTAPAADGNGWYYIEASFNWSLRTTVNLSSHCSRGWTCCLGRVGLKLIKGTVRLRLLW